MKVLLDECIDQRLRLHFPEHDCQTAQFAGFGGLKNGQLLEAAERESRDLLPLVPSVKQALAEIARGVVVIIRA
jgi:hypothetical protein